MVDWTTVLLGALTFLLTLAYMRTRRPPNAPPGPYVWPFFGNILSVTGSQFHLWAHEMYRKYGAVTSLQLAFYPAVLVSDIRVIRQLLIDRADTFSDRPLWLFLFKKFTNNQTGITFSNGERWKLHKRLILSSLRELGFGSVGLEEKIHEEVEAVIKELEQVQGKNYNFSYLFNMAAANVICAILFGNRYDYNDPEMQTLIDQMHYIMKEAGYKSPLQFLPSYLAALVPILNPNIFRLISVTNKWRKLLDTKIAQHKTSMDVDDMRDVIDVFLDAGVDQKDIRQVLGEIFLAGSETTATTLLWIFLFLVTYPDVQENCRREIFHKVGHGRMPRMKDKEQLPYMSATIMEVQRLASAVAVSTVMLNNNEATTVSGYSLPKNTLIFINQYSVHMEPANWDEPEVFRPERFLTDDRSSTIKPEAFMPFSVGRRSCLGENMAKMELFLLTSALLQKFKFEASDPDKLPGLKDCTFGGTVMPRPYSIVITST